MTWSALALAVVLVGCGSVPAEPALAIVPATAWATPRPNVVVALGYATSTVTPAGAVVSGGTAAPAEDGLRQTLDDYTGSVGNDPAGSKFDAFNTLSDFANPNSQYMGAWWFQDDGKADLYEAMAVILYTEGNTNWDVRTAVAARFLWYCGGAGTACHGAALINFLSYFQPWREPWIARGFSNAKAAQYLDFSRDIVDQRPGLLTVVIPGADTYVHSEDGLSLAGPINWSRTPFHFANVDQSWDAYLRKALRRLPNGPARLWVLTISEAGRVCRSQFVCEDMTQPRP